MREIHNGQMKSAIDAMKMVVDWKFPGEEGNNGQECNRGEKNGDLKKVEMNIVERLIIPCYCEFSKYCDEVEKDYNKAIRIQKKYALQ